MGNRANKRAVIHIGTEKTGTTSLQNVFANSRMQLRNQGILFPRSAGLVNHTILVAASEDDGLVDNIKAHILASRRCSENQLRRKFRVELTQEMQSGPPWHTLLLSSELIHSRLHTRTEVERLLSFLRDAVDEIQIVVVLRRQDRLAVSRFSTAIRAGHTGFDDVFGDIAGHGFLQVPDGRDISDMVHYYDYAALLDRFIDHTEDANIVVRLHDADRQKFDPLEVLSETLEFDRSLFVNATPELNKAMSAEAQFVISQLNRRFSAHLPSGKRDPDYIALIRQIETDLPGRPRTVARHEAEAFLARFAVSNERVRARFFPDRPTLFDDDFSMYPEAVDYSDLNLRLAPLIAGYAAEAQTFPSGASNLEDDEPILVKIRRKLEKKKEKIKRKLKKQPIASDFLRVCRWGTVMHRNLGTARPQVPGNNRGKFVVARVMGNDLYPRHGAGQMMKNLRFILENEPNLPNCKKLFVLNRLFDADRETEALKLIEKYDAQALVIPFVSSEYAKSDWDIAPFGRPDFFESKAFSGSSKFEQTRMCLVACGPKIRYAMNINGARNSALRAGRELAEWTAVLDGNCIFTDASFAQFRKNCMSSSFAPFVVIPMQRLEQNTDYFGQEPGYRSPEEPQVAFHHSASQNFDERLLYGLRDKTSLLKSLGVPGPWHVWSQLDWLPDEVPRSAEKYHYKWSSGAVFRLSSGGAGLEQRGAQENRYGTRNVSILATISELNAKHGTVDPPLGLKIFDGNFPGTKVRQINSKRLHLNETSSGKEE